MSALVNQNEFTKFYAQVGVNSYSIPQTAGQPHGSPTGIDLTLTTVADEGAPITNNGTSITILQEGMYSICASVQYTAPNASTNFGGDVRIIMTSDVDPARNSIEIAEARTYIGEAIPNNSSPVINLSFIGYFNATDVFRVNFTNVSNSIDTVTAGGTSSNLYVCKIY